MHEVGFGQRVILLVVFAVAVFADGFHATDGSLRCFEQEILRVLAAPSGFRDDFHVFRGKYDDALPQGDAAVIGHGIGDSAKNLFRCVAAVVFHVAEAAAGEDGDAGHALRVALLLAQQRPRIATGSFRDAEAVFARVALGGFVGNAGDHLEHIPQNQPRRPSDRRVRAIAGAEQIHIRIHADALGIVAADDQQRGRPPCACGGAVEIEIGLVHRLERRDHDGEIFRQAAGHDGVDGGGVDGELQAGGGVGGDHGFRRATFIQKCGFHAFDHGRDDGQAIGPALLITIVDGGEQVVGDIVDAVGVEGHGSRFLDGDWYSVQQTQPTARTRRIAFSSEPGRRAGPALERLAAGIGVGRTSSV